MPDSQFVSHFKNFRCLFAFRLQSVIFIASLVTVDLIIIIIIIKIIKSNAIQKIIHIPTLII